MVRPSLLGFHDTIDDSFVDYDHIFHTFGAGVANLVEGLCIRSGSVNIDIFMYQQFGGRVNCNYLISIMMVYSQFFKSMIM
jgi:hypothetical protein